MANLNHKYDFVLLFDIKDGNPNGDPDAGNLPRVDPETGQGLVTDVCLKRKVRNFITLSKQGAEGFDIYVKEKAVLSAQQGKAYAALGLKSGAAEESPPAEESSTDKKGKKGPKAEKSSGKKSTDADDVEKARDWMCRHFYDIRTFGAVMSLKENNCGQVRGAVQLTFGRSIDPIVTLEHSITRMAVATQKEADNQGGDNRTMGRKNTVPYALYRAHGFVLPALAHQTGFSSDDLLLLWESFHKMFELDRSAARGLLSLRELIIFEHASELGSAPSHKLFELVKVTRNDMSKAPRDFSDYTVQVGELPAGVKRVGV